MFAFKYCNPNLCSPSCLKTPNPGAMDSLMQQATGNKPNGTLRPFPASQISSGMPNSATKNVRRKRRKLVVTGCHGEETNSEKRSFLSLEEAGLVEISGLSTHERFLCRLTVNIIIESSKGRIRRRRASYRGA
ncbi:hypothetical protein M5K25_012427 [Dendrobium thyrsiflorum]|uniref:Uncharacterized protein n=1 Tax=Dendrobium thyrsiflorum TaxID=117978 RepID=A0ABD0UXE9_DENTH